MLFSARIFVLSAAFACASVYAVNDGEVIAQGDAMQITAADLRDELRHVPAQSLGRVLDDPSQHLALVNGVMQVELYVRRALEEGLDQDPLIQARIERSRRQILAEALRDRVLSEVEVPDMTELAREHYQSNKERYTLPEHVRARHILLRVSNEEERTLAQQTLMDVAERVRSGESFADIASEISEDQGSAARGGDLGFFTRGQMVPPFEEAAFSLSEPGELSGIVESRFGLHLIELTERKEERVQPFEEVKPSIVSGLSDEYRRKYFRTWNEDLMEANEVSIDKQKLQEFFREEGSRLSQ